MAGRARRRHLRRLRRAGRPQAPARVGDGDRASVRPDRGARPPARPVQERRRVRARRAAPRCDRRRGRADAAREPRQAPGSRRRRQRAGAARGLRLRGGAGPRQRERPVDARRRDAPRLRPHDRERGRGVRLPRRRRTVLRRLPDHAGHGDPRVAVGAAARVRRDGRSGRGRALGDQHGARCRDDGDEGDDRVVRARHRAHAGDDQPPRRRRGRPRRRRLPAGRPLDRDADQAGAVGRRHARARRERRLPADRARRRAIRATRSS